MSPIVSRMVRWMSSSACVVTSPITMHRPLVMAVSQATRAWGSWASIPSRTESETWSQTLSGCPSVTDSEVSRNDADSLKEVVTTAANDTCGGTGDSVAERRRSVDPARVSRKPDRKAGGPIRSRCAAGCPRAIDRAVALAARRCHRGRDRYACPRGDDRRSHRRVPGCGAVMFRAAHRFAPFLSSEPLRAAGGTGRAQAVWTYGSRASCQAVPSTSTRPAAVTLTLTVFKAGSGYD